MSTQEMESDKAEVPEQERTTQNASKTMSDMTRDFMDAMNLTLKHNEEKFKKRLLDEFAKSVNGICDQVKKEQILPSDAWEAIEQMVAQANGSKKEESILNLSNIESQEKPKQQKSEIVSTITRTKILPHWKEGQHISEWIQLYESRATNFGLEAVMSEFFVEFMHTAAGKKWTPYATTYRAAPWPRVREQAITVFYPVQERENDKRALALIKIEGSDSELTQFNTIISKLQLVSTRANIMTYHFNFLERIASEIPDGVHKSSMDAWLTAYSESKHELLPDFFTKFSNDYIRHVNSLTSRLVRQTQQRVQKFSNQFDTFFTAEPFLLSQMGDLRNH
jgi:hypothetical protein